MNYLFAAKTQRPKDAQRKNTLQKLLYTKIDYPFKGAFLGEAGASIFPLSVSLCKLVVRKCNYN